jgi:CheY-like chemotaxis protein
MDGRLSRQIGEAVSRTARAVTRMGSRVGEVDNDRMVDADGCSSPTIENRELGLTVGRGLENRRSQRGRRCSDRLTVGETPRILLISPEQDTRLLYACLFEAAGYAVYPVAESLAAMVVARVRLPDVVVLDLEGPNVYGPDVLRQLREDPLTSTIPIILTTSVLHFDVPVRARASGAISVLGKPTAPESLLVEVDELIRATPRERLVVRQLKRSLLMLRELGRRVRPDERAQERVRSLIDRLQVAILALDTEGRYIAVSRGASTLIGYSRTELLGRSIFDVGLALHPRVSERWQDFLAGKEAPIGEMVSLDGTGQITSLQPEFATILPGLHAAAFAG